MIDITVEELRGNLRYSPDSGHFVWVRADRFGERAGRLNNGYVRIFLGKHGPFLGHRLAWLYMTGAFPEGMIDHVDGNRANNAWTNLRKATPTQNSANSRIPKNNTTGFKGVTKYRGLYRAQISCNNHRFWLGDYVTVEEARAAYAGAAQVAFGEFARTA